MWAMWLRYFDYETYTLLMPFRVRTLDPALKMLG